VKKRRTRRFAVFDSTFTVGEKMNSKVIRKQINTLGLARNRPIQLVTSSLEKGAGRKAKQISAQISQLRKSAPGRRRSSMVRLVREADALEDQLNLALKGTADA
jgi:hypothetical protein